MKIATIWGDSLTGLACAFLLAKAGYFIKLVSLKQNSSPPILMSEEAVFLLQEVFGNVPNLKECLFNTKERTITSNQDERIVGPDNSFGCDSAELRELLLEYLIARFKDSVTISMTADYQENDLNIFADASFRDSQLETECFKFDRRHIYSFKIMTPKAQNLSVANMELKTNSWSFNFPLSETTRCMQLMVPMQFANEGELQKSLQTHFERFKQYTQPTNFKLFDGAPAIYKFNGNNKTWLTGNALSKYDPVCGNGTANHLKSVLLLAGVINKNNQKDFLAAKEYYYTRVGYGMRLHLTQCLDFYSTSFQNNCWKIDVNIMNSWMNKQLQSEKAGQQYYLTSTQVTR